jgi:ribosome-associated toxin RatA of RatAB toxin-antitoxin module
MNILCMSITIRYDTDRCMKAILKPNAALSRGRVSNDNRRNYRGEALVLAIALALAWVTPVLPASISVTAERRGDTIDITASALLNAEAATAWRVLTDYDRYTQFIPNLHVSRVIARHGASVTVEQSGNAALWFFRKRVDVTYHVTESPPNTIHSRAIGGSLRALTSTYSLTPDKAGVRLDYVGHIAPGYEILGPIEQIAVRRNVESEFRALADEIERSSGTIQDTSVSR